MIGTENRRRLYANILKAPDMQRVIEEYIKNMIEKHNLKTYEELLYYMESNFEPAYFQALDFGEEHYKPYFTEINKAKGKMQYVYIS